MKLPDKDVQHVDLPEISETFADSLGMSFFDGQLARITFTVTRFNPPKPPHPPSAKRYPSCRLVLPAEVLVDLHNQLNNIVGVMEKQGLVKREGPKLVATPPTETKQ